MCILGFQFGSSANTEGKWLLSDAAASHEGSGLFSWCCHVIHCSFESAVILASFGIGNVVTQMLASCCRWKVTVDVFMADIS